jgi:PKD repeat protein
LPEFAQQLFTVSAPPVAFKSGPDGDIYYLAWDVTQDNGQLRHIRFVEGNRAPVANASASPQGGLAPLSVQFSRDGSFDADGDDISYAWDFGDGGTSDEADPLHVFQENGVHHSELTITDTKGASSSVAVNVTVGNQAPVATIAPLLPGASISGGETVTFSGSGYDPEAGMLAPSRLRWTALLHHCYVVTLGCHSHPYINKTGSGGTLIAPRQDFLGELIYLELRLTVTDSAGLSDTASVEIGPDSDGDGLLDQGELLVAGTDYLNPDSDDDGCPDGAETGPNPRSGGLRNPTNSWDYFNPTNDGKNRIDDLVAVVHQYLKDDADDTPGRPPYTAGYSADTDRTAVGPNDWNLGPPNGLQRVDDILAIIKQYFHDCS